jgi:hypothetical protein
MRYAHTILLVCPDCNLPVAITRVSPDKSFEDIDREPLRLKCSFCQKESTVLAISAKRHYVEEWQ